MILSYIISCYRAVAITCMGAFALAAFTAERRKKELAIRKAVGATAVQLVALLGGFFAKTVLAGAIVAIPVAIWLAEDYLQQFNYRIAIP